MNAAIETHRVRVHVRHWRCTYVTRGLGEEALHLSSHLNDGCMPAEPMEVDAQVYLYNIYIVNQVPYLILMQVTHSHAGLVSHAILFKHYSLT